MNAATLVMVPLRATMLSTRWVTLMVLGSILAISVGIELTLKNHDAVLLAPIISGYGEFFVGLFFVAPFLLMAIDTRELRIPRSQPAIVFAMLLYSALWIAVPSLVLSVTGAHFATVLAMQTVGLLFGLMFGLLPRAFVIVAGLAPSFLGIMNVQWHHSGKPAVLPLWLVAALLALVSAYCWRRQVRLSNPYGEGFNKPLVVRSRSNNRSGFNNWNDWTGSCRKIRSQPQWLQPVANLRHTGPKNPVRSLRIGLGGYVLPKTWQSASRQWMIVLVPIALLMLLLYVRAPESTLRFFHDLGYSVVVWLTGFGSMMLALTNVAMLQQRWSRTHAELPLLALLPKLGDGEQVKKHLLRASVLPTFFWQAMLAALLLVVSFLKQETGLNFTMAVLTQIVAIVFTPAFAFAIFGGRQLAQWVPGLVAGLSFALVGLGTAAMSMGELYRAMGSIGATSIIAVWLAALAFLVWLGARGWHGLQARPHPFLAN